MRIKPKLLIVSETLGSLNAFLPLVKGFKKDKNLDTHLILAEQAGVLAVKKGINFNDADNWESKKLINYLDRLEPDFILTGGSGGDSLEKRVLKWAKPKKIKTASYIDFWANYKMRFSSGSGYQKEFDLLPDKIFVIDEYMKNDLLRLGIEKEKIIITGSPFFETFASVTAKDRAKEQNYILFVSQPFSEFPITLENLPVSKNLNEITIFEDLLKLLQKNGLNIAVKIAIHPRSKRKDKFKKVIEKSRLKVVLIKGSLEKHIKKSRLVVGMNSTVLFEAGLMGKKVISYQPGFSKENDPLIGNKIGLTFPAYNYKKFSKLLAKTLEQLTPNRALLKARKKYINSNAKSKIFKEINQMVFPKDKKLKIVAAIQARFGSSRLPRKALRKIMGRTLLEWIAYRLSFCKEIDQVIFCIPDNKSNNPLAQVAQKNNISVYRGSEDDLISRFQGAAQKFKADAMVRITGDCPLVDPLLVDKLAKKFRKSKGRLNYVGNVYPPSFPHGLDAELISFETLERLDKMIKDPVFRELITATIWKNPRKFKIYNLKNKKNLTHHRLTVDYPEDFELVEIIIKKLHKEGEIFMLKDILALFKKEPSLIEINSHRSTVEVKGKIRKHALDEIKKLKKNS